MKNGESKRNMHQSEDDVLRNVKFNCPFDYDDLDEEESFIKIKRRKKNLEDFPNTSSKKKDNHRKPKEEGF